MTPRDYIGRQFPVYAFDVERSQLRLFAKAIGETRPIYTDPAVARQAGYRDCPVPPTFLFTIGMNPDDPFDALRELDIDLRRVLHGEQAFEYSRPICVGDRIRVKREVLDIYEKKNGALTFFVIGFRFEDARSGELYCSARQAVISRSEEINSDA